MLNGFIYEARAFLCVVQTWLHTSPSFNNPPRPQRQLQAAQGAVAQLQERHAQLKQELDKERTQVGHSFFFINTLQLSKLQAVNAVGSNAAAMWKNKYIKIRTQLDALRQERQEAS